MAIVEVCPEAARASSCVGCAGGDRAFCAGLDETSLAELSRRTRTRTVEAGKDVFLPGQRPTSVFSVRTGCVKLYKLLSDGHCQIVDFLYPGDFFSVPKGSSSGYGAQALEDSELCCLSQGRNESLCMQHPQVALRQLEAVQRSLLSAHEQQVALGRLSALERVAAFLVETSARKREAGCTTEPIEIGLSRLEIAEYLGLTVETVCRAWTRLRRKGAIVAASSRAFSICEAELSAECSRVAVSVGVD